MGQSIFVRARATVATTAMVAATLVVVAAPPAASAATFAFEAVAADATHPTGAPAVSADGRYVVFDTLAALTPDDTNGHRDVYRRELATGATVRVSVQSSGASFSFADAFGASVSSDGSRVAFTVDFTEAGSDVYVRDLPTSTTARVDQTTSLLIGGVSVADDISEDGSAVVWTTYRQTTDYVAGVADTNGVGDVMVTTLGAGLAVSHQVVSLDEDGNGTNNGESWDGSANSDGTAVTYLSLGTEDMGGMFNTLEDVWVWNGSSTFPVTGVTFQGHDPFGGPIEGSWNNLDPVMLDDGRVLFLSEEPLVSEDTNGTLDAYAWSSGNTWQRLVTGYEDQLYEDVLGLDAAADGTVLVFETTDTQVLDIGLVEPTRQVYRQDLASGEIVFVPMTTSGPHEMAGTARAHHTDAVTSSDGSVIAFVSPDGLAAGDTNGQADVVVATETVPLPAPQLAATTATTGLARDGDTVSVSGTSFAPNGTVSVQQCADVAGMLTCETTAGVTATTDASGAFTADVPVRATTDAFANCPEDGCVVRAHDGVGIGGPREPSAWVNERTTSVATGPSMCPPGTVMTGLDVRADYIGGDPSRGIVVAAAARCGSATGPMIGPDPGAVDQSSPCPGTAQVTGLGGRHGDLLDLLHVICRDADGQDLPTNPELVGPAVGDVDGSPGGTPFTPVTCPAGMWAVGIDGAHLNAYANPLQSIRLVCADKGGSRVAIAFAAAPPEHRDLRDLTLDVTLPEGSSVPAGLDRVPVADIPAESIPFANVSIGAAPLKSIDLSAAPLKSIPLKSIPLKSIPLKSITLAQLPLQLDGGWAARLVGTTLEGLPLQTVTLEQVSLEPAPTDDAGNPLPHPLDGIELSQVGVQSSPLKSIGLASIALGATPLKSIPLKSIDTSAQNPSAGVCPFVDEVLPTDPATIAANWQELLTCLGIAVQVGDDTTLVDIDIAGAPLTSIPLKSIPLKSIDLSASPLKSIPLKSIDLSASPLKSIPLKSIELAPSPLKSIPLKSIDLSASPLKSIPLASIPLKSIVVDCRAVDCADTSTQTLGDAADRGAILEGAILVDLGAALSGYALGDLFGATGSATIGDVQAWLLATQGEVSISLADVLIALLLRTDYPWEELPLADMHLQEVAPTAERVTASLTFATDGAPNAGDDLVIRAELPPGATYTPGSTVLEVATLTAGPSGPLGSTSLLTVDPAVSAGSLTWVVGAAALDDTTIDLTFEYWPGARLVPETLAATVTVGPADDQTAAVTATAYQVTERSRSDDDPSTAPVLTDGNTLVVGHIAEPGDVDYFTIPASAVAGKRVSIDLAVPGVDQDLVLYSPVEAAGVIDATPLKSIPLKSIAMEDEGTVRPGEVVPPETLQDIPLKSIPLKSISANRDGTDEAIDVLAGEDTTGSYTIQVSGYNGATSTEPYVLRLRVTTPPDQLQCPDSRVLPHPLVSPTSSAAAAAPAGTDTLFVVNPSRLDASYGPGSATSVLTALQRLDAAGLGVDGHVLAVDQDSEVRAAYAAWDAAPCSPDAANAVVEEIVRVVEASHTSAGESVEHVVLVGGDDVVPQARIPDLTRLSNERDYLQEVGNDNPLAGAFATEHLLSDDPYGDRDPIPWLNRFMYVPDVALGRLVETPAEIEASIDRFVTWDGSLDPSTATSTVAHDALVTGYDFLADGATAVADALVDALPGQPTVDRELINEQWTRQQLVDKLLGTDVPHVAAVNAHFDHHRSLPGAGNAANDESDLFTTVDVVDPDGDGNPETGTPPPGLDQRLLFSMGCHSGLNVPDVYVAGTEDDDWAQVFARQGAGAYVGNTGYGYGDTATVALSERLMAEFASRLDGSMTVGEAMTFAKQAYAAQLGIYGAYDEKVLAEATFYGLPMFRVTDQAVATPDLPEVTTTPVAGASGLSASTFTLGSNDLGLVTHTEPDGSTFQTVGPQAPQVTSGRPITPRTDLDVTAVDGTPARGVLLTSLTSSETRPVTSTFARAVVDDSAREPAVATDVAFPASFASVNRFRDPLGERSQLVLMPGQFVPDDDRQTVGMGTRRSFSHMEGVVYYSDDPDVVAPSFTATEARTNGSTVTFEATVHEVGGAVLRVVVLYRDQGGAWKRAELAPGLTAGTWRGTTTVASEDVEYLVQAVDTAGNVGTTTNKGFLYAAAVETTPPTVTVSAPSAGSTYLVGEAVALDVACEDANFSQGTCTATIDGVPVQVGSPIDTSAGSHTLEVIAVDDYGNTTTETVTYTALYDVALTSQPMASGGRGEVKAGSAVPVRFKVSDADGYVGDRAAIQTITSAKLTCGSDGVLEEAPVETTTVGSGLTYDTTTNEWQYVWKTDRKWRNTCRQLHVVLSDGSVLRASFTMR